ncbi:uncharacterized protein LOC135836983 [Planococcus citri]|uniref:uncharacterized protein LOC135836983 n=1 Tax=Planococcus citri TaxID=170843 RepID=UPI0031FA0707
MAKYWAFSRILAGLEILVVFASSAPAAPSTSPSADEQLAVRIQELEAQVKELRAILKTILPNNIVVNIQSRQFSVAEEQLQFIEDYKHIASQVYNGSINNFDLLLNFGNDVKDHKHRFNVYNALYNEMKSNGHKDISKLLQLSESLQKGISSPWNNDNIVETQSLISTIWDENQDAAIEPISNAFLNDSSWEMVKQLTNVINGSSVKYVDKVYTKVIEKIFGKMDTVEILRKAKANLKCLDECVSIHRAVFNQLQSNGDLFGNSTISLTRYIKATMDDADYKNTHPDMQTRHKEIKDKLPKSVRNAVFSSSVCVKNTKYNEFFYPSGLSNDTNSNDLHIVSTLINGDGGSAAIFKWKVSFLDNSTNFNLTNEALNEYFYTHHTHRTQLNITRIDEKFLPRNYRLIQSPV